MPTPVDDIYSAELRRKREREAREMFSAPEVDVEIGPVAIEASEQPYDYVRALAEAETPDESTAPRRARERSRLAEGISRDERRSRERSEAYDRSIVDGLIMDGDYLDAAHDGVVQGLTLGFGDEIAGAGRALTREGSYADERDRIRAQNDKSQREHPLIYGASEIVGGVPITLAIPGAGPAASLTRRALTSGAVGMGLGGVSGAGHSRGDFGDGQFFSDTARDAAIGAGAGVMSELAMAGLGRLRQLGQAAPEGTPAPGRDFTPEQRAQAEQTLDAGDPDVFDQMTTRDALEDAAAQRRVRSTADSAALSDVRRAGDYHGPGGEGYRGLARDLDTTGISPRGSITRSSTAQQRASRLENQAGREIGGFRDEMMSRVRPDDFQEGAILDDLPPRAPGARDPSSAADDFANAVEPPAEQATGGARAGRQRPRGVSVMERTGDTIADGPPVMDAPIDRATLEREALETRASVNDRADPARVRYTGDVMRSDANGRVSLTPANTSSRLREEAAQARASATTREQHAAASQLEALADDIDQLRPESFDAAQRRLRALDDEAAYGTRYPNATGASPERTSRARTARGGVRADMDEAVRNTLGEEALQRYQQARGRFGVARSVGVLGERGAAREAANLQAGLGDTIAVHAGLSRGGGPVERVWNAVEGVIVNRYLRGMGHTAVAAAQEMQSDAMARAIVRRLGERPVTEPMARALAEAQRRGPRAFGVALVTLGRQSPEAQEAVTEAVSAFNADGSPNYDVVPGARFAPEDPDAPIEPGEAPALDWSLVPGARFAPDDEEEQRR